jgi:hypothetical protein
MQQRMAFKPGRLRQGPRGAQHQIIGLSV